MKYCQSRLDAKLAKSVLLKFPIFLILFSFFFFLTIFLQPSQAQVSLSIQFKYSVNSTWFNDAVIDKDGNILVLSGYNTNNGNIKKFKTSTGELLATYSSGGTADGKLNMARGIALDSAGNIFVMDSYNYRIQKFDNNGNYVSKFGSYGTGDGQFSTSPGGIAIDSNDNIWAVDTGSSRIEKFSSAGVYLGSIGSSGSGNGNFYDPGGIAIGQNGNIYVADVGNNRIMILDSNGGYLTQFGTYGSGNGQFNLPWSVDVDSSGRIYVGDKYNNRVQVFDSSMQFLTAFNGVGITGATTMHYPVVRVDSTGNMYVGNSSSIWQKFSAFGDGNQITNVPSGFDVLDVNSGQSIKSSESFGVSGSAVVLRVTNSSSKYINDVVVDMSADRNWPALSVNTDVASGKSVVGVLFSLPGVNVSTNTLYVPIPDGRDSTSVYLCPDATNLSGVNLSCSNGVSRTAGIYGSTVVSKVFNNTDRAYYWKVTSVGTGGGVTSGLTEYSGSGSGTFGSPYQISSCAQLQEMAYNRAGNYALTQNIDCNGVAFSPIGNATNPFMGNLDGAGYTIQNLSFSAGATCASANWGCTGDAGMFGYTFGANILNLNFTNYSLTLTGTSDHWSDDYGGLIGHMNGGTIDYVNIAGSITNAGTDEKDNTGGMVGYTEGNVHITNSSAAVNIDVGDLGEDTGGFVGRTDGVTLIEDCSATGNISSGYDTYMTAGFVGWMLGTSTTINRSFATGNVHVGMDPLHDGGGTYDVGGFVGGMGDFAAYNTYPRGWGIRTINDSYATGSVTVDGEDNYDVGGFAGTVYIDSTINRSYSTGAVSNPEIYGNAIAGFAGLIREDSFTNTYTNNIHINDCYTRSPVSAWNTEVDGYIDTWDVGGFVGEFRHGFINNAYAAGSVSGGDPDSTGGFVGYSWNNLGVVTHSYWDVGVSGQATSWGNMGTGLTTSQLKTQSNLIGWDFDTVWSIYSGNNDGYPALDQIIWTNYDCSGSCESGATCNQYGNPPQGKMWACRLNGSVYKCLFDDINAGGSSCYLNCNSGWQSCGCNQSVCESACTAEHTNDGYGHFTYTDTCDGCGQLFTCGCDNIPLASPTPTITPTPTPSPTPGPIVRPINDDFVNAINIGNDAVINASNVNATTEVAEYTSSAYFSHTVWWKLHAASVYSLTVSLCGSDYDTYLSVGTGTAVDNYTYVAQNDDFCSLQSEVTFDTVEGTDYYIQVSGYGQNVGNIVLTITGMPYVAPTDTPTPTPGATPTPSLTPTPTPIPTFTVSDTLTRLKVGVPSDHTITFNTINGLTESGNTIVVNMVDWDISNLTVSDLRLSTDNTFLSLDDTPGVNTWGVTFEAGVITLTAPTTGSGYISAGSGITLKIGVVAGGVNQPINPENVGSYRLIVTNNTSSGAETGEASIPIVDSDQVNVTSFVSAFMTFDIDTGTDDFVQCNLDTCKIHGGDGAAAGANYTVDLGELKSTYVNKSNDVGVMHSDGILGIVNSIYFDLTTNALTGAVITVSSASEGLQGPDTKISSVTDGEDITNNSGFYGFNLPVESAQLHGTIVKNSLCESAGAFCGPTLDPKEVFNTANHPVDGARVRMDIAAAVAYTNTPGAYTDTLTFIATATF